ncbi:MAG TPA: M28 family peptidase [Pyrinomonadaceae bacterium]|nr:M28 family peptidase [Pyrinomonadaceae bacterium]
MRRALSTTLILLALLARPAATPARAAQTGQGGASPAHAARPGSASAFDADRAFRHVKRLVELGPHPAGSKTIETVRRYIVAALTLEEFERQDARPGAATPKRSALKVGLDEWVADTPHGKVRMANVVAELPGESEDAIVIASHYDTKEFKDFDFVGANDGCSSTAALLEIARVLAQSNTRPRLTYRFVFFDGEEATCREWDECGKPGAPDNTYGSRHYVAQLRAHDQLKHVRALILLDMIGYEKLELGRDVMSTPWLVDAVWKTAREIGYAKQFAEHPEEVGGDDHEPFLLAGVPSIDLIQLNTYPHWHTASDTLDKIAPASLKAVGDTVIAALPRIEEKLKEGGRERLKPAPAPGT